MGHGAADATHGGEFPDLHHLMVLCLRSILMSNQWSYSEVQVFLAQMRKGLRDPNIHAYFYV